ncbi:TPPP family protein [Amphibalanus amphitrite]|uniref:TPPP family protein n=1 Tax=Amphibalanus amphitrite TaxID=1232801 RepID=A0A6A4VRN2_AMPAM|nr:tubulin polymerization-promoting protein homolog [Amphibalanus amphitrite]KAF0296895.1 TPPP family protein [Amphibalanus amphitrite]
MTTLQAQFEKYANFGASPGSSSGGPQITLSNIDKWFKQANAFNKKLSTTDTGIHFGKLKQKKINFADFNKFLEDLTSTKKIDLEEFKQKLTDCGDPGTSGATKTVKAGAVDRLTDTSKYTGSHKERFDETGKGKGISGREEQSSNDGYVQGYKEKDSYDKSH